MSKEVVQRLLAIGGGFLAIGYLVDGVLLVGILLVGILLVDVLLVGILLVGVLLVGILLVGGVLIRRVVISQLAIDMIKSPEFPFVDLAKSPITDAYAQSEVHLPPDPKSESQGCGTKA